MLLREFEKLKVVNLYDKTDLELGEYFLTSELEEQKNTKKAGNEIVVYKVTEMRPNGNIVYKPCYINLE